MKTTLTENERRIESGEAMLLRYVSSVRLDGESALIDVLADLLHTAKAYSLDFDNSLRIARSHFVSEQKDKE